MNQRVYQIKYFKCGKNDGNSILDITKLDKFGISINGRHIGNQYLVVKKDETVIFDGYNHIYQKLNQSSIIIDFGGIYDENTILPTTISTIWYDDESSKKLYIDLKKVFQNHSSSTIKGYIILKNAYDEREQLRFATISVHSPIGYDLKI